MTVPNWYELLLLGVASWRTFQLVAFDDILNLPRRYVLRLARDWQEGDEIPDEYRLKLAIFITCSYCAGAWIALLLWWIPFQITQHWTLLAASIFVLATFPIAGHKVLSKEEDR